MPTAYLQDVQEAIVAANAKFENKTEGGMQQHFEVGTVPVMFNKVDSRWDYGHPTIYVMDRGHIQALESWWKEIHTTGRILPPQHKPMLQCWEINVQWTSADGRLFNYHVAVSDPPSNSH